MELQNKVAVVTGGSGDLGTAIATELSRQGAIVVIVSRARERLRIAAQKVHADTGVKIHSFGTDLRKSNAAASVIRSITNKLGKLDILVNCAGDARRGDLLSLSNDDWFNGFNLMLFGAVRMTRAAWPHLVNSGGHVISISGIHGITPHAGSMLGGAVCAALINFDKSLAEIGLRDGVSVNTVVPGWIESERLKGRAAAIAKQERISPTTARARMLRELGIKRFGKPADVANAVAFLVSSRGAYMRGATLVLDGGLTKSI